MTEYKFIPEEDYTKIIGAVEFLLSNLGGKRVDVSLSRNMVAKIYWAGKVIRIDIEGYNE